MTNILALYIFASFGYCVKPLEFNVGIYKEDMEKLYLVNKENFKNLSFVEIEIDAGSSYDHIKQLKSFIEDKGIHCIVGKLSNEVEVVVEVTNTIFISQDATSLEHQNKTHFFQILPTSKIITEALLSIMKYDEWGEAAVIYENSIDDTIINNLIATHYNLKFWRMASDVTNEEIKQTLRQIREIDLRQFLILTEEEMQKKIFTQARLLGVMADPFKWLVFNLGSSDIFNDMLEELRLHMLMLNMVKPKSAIVENNLTSLSVATFKDSIELLQLAVIQIDHQTVLSNEDLKKNVQNNLNNQTFFGETGFIKFQDGQREDVTFDIYTPRNNIPIKIGNWNGGEIVLNNAIDRYFPTMTNLKRKILKIVTIEEAPFIMKKKGGDDSKDRFEGFAIDLLDLIGAKMNFSYDIYLVNDGNFGAKMDNGEWNGMIGEVLANNASMAVAPISINADRENSVDFTKPFKTRSIKVLMKAPKSSPSYFQFMEPLSYGVWLSVIFSVLIVSMLLFLFEKYGRRCGKDEIKLNSHGSVWFIFGALVGGGSENSPATVPGRILSSAWWFFALILTSSYTANLAAFLTVNKINAPISSIDDLLDQTKIQFGTVKNSGVATFFKNSNVEPFRKLWTQMSEIHPFYMVNNTNEGVERVKEGSYAFFWDSSVTSYIAAMDCDFIEIGPPFDPRGLAIAMPPTSRYIEGLSLAILKLTDSGQIPELENKWWPTDKCNSEAEDGEAHVHLFLEHVAGLFFILLIGIAVSVLYAVLDFVHDKKTKKKVSSKENEEKDADMNHRL